MFGVFAKKVIQNRTVFGPYEGDECETWDYGREDRLKLRVKYTIETCDLRPPFINVNCNYRPQTKLRESNAFTCVCQSFCPPGGVVYLPSPSPYYGMRYTSRQYASYWNAFLLNKKHFFLPRPTGFNRKVVNCRDSHVLILI